MPIKNAESVETASRVFAPGKRRRKSTNPRRYIGYCRHIKRKAVHCTKEDGKMTRTMINMELNRAFWILAIIVFSPVAVPYLLMKRDHKKLAWMTAGAEILAALCWTLFGPQNHLL